MTLANLKKHAVRKIDFLIGASRTNNVVRRPILRRADHARDTGKFLLAAELYDQALAMGNRAPALLLQCGHMYKEAKSFDIARARYLEALSLEPQNAEILLQLGHYYNVIGLYGEAAHYYRRAMVAEPAWEMPQDELAHLTQRVALRLKEEQQNPAALLPELWDEDGLTADTFNGLIDRDLFAKTRDELYIEHQEAFVFTRNGNQQRTKWGAGATVRGVDSLRGYIVSATPYLHIDIFLDGELVYHDRLVVAPQRREKTNRDLKKYVYNAWIDFSRFSFGWHDLVFRAVSVAGEMRDGIDWRRQRIIIAEPVPPEVFGYCDGIVPPLDASSSMSVVDQVNARPSIVHRASTRSFPGEIKNVAVIRADQLGDMVVSVPALQRLRQLLPNARITGLLSRANEGLARSLNIFDEIIILDFPDDPHQRQRIMSREGQERLMRQLAPYKFDLAIDFPVAGVSFKLLHLTGAPVRMGYGGDGKTLDLSLSTHDPTTNNDVMRHSARTRLLSDALAAWLDSGAHVVRRDDLSRDTLRQYGVDTSKAFIVLHSGARIKFTQWPYYTELATEIVGKLGMQVIFMADHDPQQRLKAKLPALALEEGRIIYIDQVLPFDHFDTFLSFCAVFVGNDSGPKHLAALRGTQVVSLHSSRIGWSEWGQEQTGVVISRQVPCAGCSIHHDPEECGQGVACITKISVAEVFREVKALAATTKVAP